MAEIYAKTFGAIATESDYEKKEAEEIIRYSGCDAYKTERSVFHFDGSVSTIDALDFNFLCSIVKF